MVDMTIESGPFAPTWESLRQFQCPEWFRDAKFGIWSHWGPQSVPMYGDWYARQMYVEGSDQYRYHLRKYGHPSKFGYKDVVQLWKAEKFDPDGLMALYVAAGARYFVAQAAHHDNFHNWNSTQHRWNAVNMGPQKDILQLWKDAAQAHGLPFGFSEHIGATFSWYVPNKGADKAGAYAGVPYDGNDPAYEDLYLPNRGAKGWEDGEWYTSNPWWHEKWYTYVKELIDTYQPDLLYSDGGVPFGDYGLHAIAHLYNSSARRHGGVNQAVYTQKDKNVDVLSVGVFDIERSQRPDIFPYVWQTDTSVGDWFYNVRDVYKTPKQVAEMLVDIVSKNGNLLLNIPQRPNGTLDDECTYLLERMAAWIKVNGEGIYGTRPWQVSGEGPASVIIEGFREDAVPWTIEDFRFTAKGQTVYAFQMKWPEGGKTVVRSLAQGRVGKVVDVTLLGAGPVPFTQTARGLAVDLPEQKPCEYAQCLRVTLA
ncbi:MAG: alpha-L-fucosidase [Anaerolineae bacterium]